MVGLSALSRKRLQISQMLMISSWGHHCFWRIASHCHFWLSMKTQMVTLTALTSKSKRKSMCLCLTYKRKSWWKYWSRVSNQRWSSLTVTPTRILKLSQPFMTSRGVHLTSLSRRVPKLRVGKRFSMWKTWLLTTLTNTCRCTMTHQVRDRSKQSHLETLWPVEKWQVVRSLRVNTTCSLM